MTTKGGELLKYLASIKEKYNMEQKDIDEVINLIYEVINLIYEIINLIYEMVIEMIKGKNGNNKN